MSRTSSSSRREVVPVGFAVRMRIVVSIISMVKLN